MWNNLTFCSVCKLAPKPTPLLLPRFLPLAHVFKRRCKGLGGSKHPAQTPQNEGLKRTSSLLPARLVSSKAKCRRYAKTYPVLDGRVLSVYRHVFEENLRNSEAVVKR